MIVGLSGVVIAVLALAVLTALLRWVLHRHGIRSTAARMPGGGPVRISAEGYVLGRVGEYWQVLVFPRDTAAARRLVAPAPGNSGGPADAG